MKNIITILHLQFLTDFRQKFSIFSVLIYLVSSSFIAYKVFGQIPNQTWNALFWIILMFSGISSTIITFGNQFKLHKTMYHQLFHPLELFFAKYIYTTILLFFMGIMLMLTLSIFSNFPIKRYDWFFGCLFLSSLGMAGVLNFIAAISSIAEVNNTVTSVLVIPILLPILLLGVKIVASALGLITDTTLNIDFMLLLAVDTLILGIIILLFPQLWKA